MASLHADVFRDALDSDKESETEKERRKRKAGRIGSQEREENERKQILDELKEIRNQFVDIQQMRSDIIEIKGKSHKPQFCSSVSVPM